MTTNNRHVIIGAGLAGSHAAETLRNEGYTGEIVLIGAEPVGPYERPPLSKGYLRGESPRAAVFVHDDDFYAAAGIDIRTGVTAISIDTDSQVVTTDDGEQVAYDGLLLATGSEPRPLAVDGADRANVFRLRTIADADALRSSLAGQHHLTVVGAGWIGCEVAASARELGLDVTVVDPSPHPLRAVLGDELGAFYAALHRSNGVEFRLGTRPVGIAGGDGATTVVLDDGSMIETDVVVAGVGVVPRTGLAQAARLTVDDGIQVQANLESSVRGVFAAGDVASAWHPHYRRHLRVDHWANARNQGETAAKNMLGGVEIYDRLPYFFSDQYDVGMEYTGHADGADGLVIRGDLGDREFIAFWTKGGRVIAGMNVNTWDVVDQIKGLILSAKAVSPEALADPDVPLEAVHAHA